MIEIKGANGPMYVKAEDISAVCHDTDSSCEVFLSGARLYVAESATDVMAKLGTYVKTVEQTATTSIARCSHDMVYGPGTRRWK